MFTGIIETTGRIVAVEQVGTNRNFTIGASLTAELKVDQSIAHNGVCLTVTEIMEDTYRVTAVDETLKKTNLRNWKPGDLVNLERALTAHARLDGHFVQGHVDTVATCTQVTELDGSWLYQFTYPTQFATLLIEKGSVSINGTSLTVFNVTALEFTVTIIPYTYHHTNFHQLNSGDTVNIEFDMLGKYVNRIMALKV